MMKTNQINSDISINLPILLFEIFVLTITMLVLRKLMNLKRKDRLDELFTESRDMLRQIDDFLEKRRLRTGSTKHSYLDDEPHDTKPLNLEIPILHIAIIDTLGTTRNKLERGDAGDTVSILDSIVLSVTSIVDDDMESVATDEEKVNEDLKAIEMKYQHLWDEPEEINSS